GFIEGATKAGKTLGKDLIKDLDRESAIKYALVHAKKGDIVLILGKGHEKSILRADGPHEFNDADVIRKLLKSNYGS
ncbi:UDP-N-acetylmuramyl peptide synthase, partial [Candidatus Saccharibacteria bacterium]|nr:UDP-N-acetylmuramyl peptide synthase [Candidatus Saccharibacteria bacterium]